MVPSRVLLPRPAGRGHGLAELLRARGLCVDLHPVVELLVHRDEPMRTAATSVASGGVEHLVLTSPRAVEALAAQTDGGMPVIPASVTVTVVGEGTASALQTHGRVPDRVADGSGQALVEQFPPAPADGARVLFPASAAAARTVPEGLAAKGYAVAEVVAYTPRPVELPVQAVRDLRGGAYQAVVLTSSMIARIIAELGVHHSIRIVTIGEPTTQAAQAAGLAVDRQAAGPTDQDLAEAVGAVLSDCWIPSDTATEETSR